MLETKATLISQRTRKQSEITTKEREIGILSADIEQLKNSGTGKDADVKKSRICLPTGMRSSENSIRSTGARNRQFLAL